MLAIASSLSRMKALVSGVIPAVAIRSWSKTLPCIAISGLRGTLVTLNVQTGDGQSQSAPNTACSREIISRRQLAVVVQPRRSHDLSKLFGSELPTLADNLIV